MKAKNRFDGVPPAVAGAAPTTTDGRSTRTSMPTAAPAARTAPSACSFTRS